MGIATVSALALGSLATWTSWKMQRILISSHKQNLQYIANRFPQDVEIYSDMGSLSTGMQKTIDNLTTANTLIWVKGPDASIVAGSEQIKVGSTGSNLLSLTDIPDIPKIRQVNGRYWLICAAPFKFNGVYIGDVYVADDITPDQTMFLASIGNLIIVSSILIVSITVAIALYIKKSLQPLHEISQITESISADRLAEAQIHLEKAPSEVKELAKTFDEMLMRLSEAWEHQRQLLSNVSHELRTPLTIVSGYLQSTLRRGDNLTETQREALTIASGEADRTIQLLQDLLDLARADSGRMHFHLEPLVLNDFVLEVVGMGRQYSDRVINFESTAEPIKIKADVNRLKQVLLNLIDNAVKYDHTNQPVTVKIDKQGKQAIIQVCDRGLGIPLAQQARIFERFYRVDEARSRSTGGTGLGLSIVKTLAEGMGGSISVRSELNKGSTFTVTFPAIALQ